MAGNGKGAAVNETRLQGILLDTSVWIRYLRPEGDEDIKAEVKRVLLSERVFTCWVVKAELLVGARDEESFERLNADLEALEEIPLTKELWLGAARLGHMLRRKGITVPLPDLLIAQVALMEKLELWHADEHFEHVKGVVPLETKPFIK
ncbi:MAG: PIN domain nuclease [Methanomassiliicoccales archaeon]|nr:PIN domain nuclease [Methanomassiliicoccales archaeon]